MWSIQPIPQWRQDHHSFAKKFPNEAAAVFANLDRLLGLLNRAPNAKSVQAGFLHTEGKGVLAVDQKGQGRNLRETRLYVYADDAEKVLYLITTGNKRTQPKDIAFAHGFVNENFSKERKK